MIRSFLRGLLAATLLMHVPILVGCSGAGRYAKARALDFYDILPISVSRGKGACVLVRASAFFTGLGKYEGYAYGLAPGRMGGSWKVTRRGMILLFQEEESLIRVNDKFLYRWPGGPDLYDLKSGLYRGKTVGFFVIPLPHDSFFPAWYTLLDADADLFVGVAGIRAGFSPSQVIDFLLGLFGLDPLKDDPDGPTEQEIRELERIERYRESIPAP
jgi:hypothetical protein